MSAKEKMEKAGDGGVEEMERQQVCNTSEPLLRQRERENTDISKNAQCMCVCVCEFSPSSCALLKKEKKCLQVDHLLAIIVVLVLFFSFLEGCPFRWVQKIK